MADAASNIENILHAIERKPFAYQLKKVKIPPIIARVTEILGRVRIQGAKFVGHHAPGQYLDCAIERCARMSLS
jgi:hypothetical protein